MADLATLAMFTAASIVLTITPGPDMLLIASRSLSQGRMAGLMTYAGIAAGSYLQAFAAAFGLSQLFIMVPAAYEILRWAGAAYLAWLAWTTLRSAAPLFSPTTGAARLPMRRIFVQGLLTNLLNPKMALFMLALLPQFLRPETGSIALQVIVLATILNATGLVTNGIVILTASRLGQALARRPHLARWPQKLMGAVFGALAVRLALSSRE
ncbi:LysE family translocator [Bosea sp. PAMC 26642]|uniref:LysE family translocator n=1 Tax=Bosea sp. (strain PAMC 26642) TaxID=1792307 RepID=UPI00077005C0|nr:LysE family translocator [Bosea sp. PAMC 26642]AMJ60233.1 amino acid transporter [Bosea sp. PAMC 26642]